MDPLPAVEECSALIVVQKLCTLELESALDGMDKEMSLNSSREGDCWIVFADAFGSVFDDFAAPGAFQKMGGRASSPTALRLLRE